MKFTAKVPNLRPEAVELLCQSQKSLFSCTEQEIDVFLAWASPVSAFLCLPLVAFRSTSSSYHFFLFPSSPSPLFPLLFQVIARSRDAILNTEAKIMD